MEKKDNGTGNGNQLRLSQKIAECINVKDGFVYLGLLDNDTKVVVKTCSTEDVAGLARLKKEWKLLSLFSWLRGFPKPIGCFYHFIPNPPNKEQSNSKKKERFNLLMEYIPYTIEVFLAKRKHESANMRTQNSNAVQFQFSLACSMIDLIHRLHHVGYVHRDLKPEHFLIRADGTMALIDFGLALPIEQACRLQRSRGRRFLGNYKYATDAQRNGDPTGFRDDLESTLRIIADILPWVISSSSSLRGLIQEFCAKLELEQLPSYGSLCTRLHRGKE